MTIHLPDDLESSLREQVDQGHFATVDHAMAEAVRLLIQTRKADVSKPGPLVEGQAIHLGSIGAMRDDAEELDAIVADAIQQRLNESWRVMPGE